VAADPLAELPNDIAERIRRLGEADLDAWVRKPIPALGDRSVMEVHGSPGGDDELRHYLQKVEGYFGG
jgi:hypothetical protein